MMAWMEARLTAGSSERPVYRYYLSRNRNLYAVRAQGEDGKRLSLDEVDECFDEPGGSGQNPCCGAH